MHQNLFTIVFWVLTEPSPSEKSELFLADFHVVRFAAVEIDRSYLDQTNAMHALVHDQCQNRAELETRSLNELVGKGLRQLLGGISPGSCPILSRKGLRASLLV